MDWMIDIVVEYIPKWMRLTLGILILVSFFTTLLVLLWNDMGWRGIALMGISVGATFMLALAILFIAAE